VIVRGRKYPIIGTVSMDNVTIDVGPEPVASVGDPATIIGADGGQRQTAEELARRIGTINYEITCGVSGRVPREYHRDGAPVD
jgi:alanine racemase